ncbi:unnamed protein product [Cylicostephanus goldi]|uniref:Synaptotagmin SMP domain-containing protein n=1 Tax=Cylicostephanus goldi TaxID=71465 RepID=A0A3P6RDL1_CYLGO|nr:unnamed protein product [Cylicostephanus goldi]
MRNFTVLYFGVGGNERSSSKFHEDPELLIFTQFCEIVTYGKQAVLAPYRIPTINLPYTYRNLCMRYLYDFLLLAQMPGVFKNFKFTKMDMGDIPCRVGGIKVYTSNVGRDRIIVDMDVAYAGDADFTVSCCGFTGGMTNLQFSGKLRAVLKPLLPYPPMIGGVSGSFLEMPKIDFNLTGMGEMVELPGLMNAIRSVINSQV